MRRTIVLLVALAALPACGGDEPPDDPTSDRHIAFRRTRVAVADAQQGRVTIIDAEFSEIRAVLELPNPVSLHASGTGSVAAAVDAAANTVRFLTPGVSIVDHTGEGWEGKEHIHVYKFVPTVLDATIDGPAPGPLVAHQSQWAAYFAGDEDEPASAALFDEAPLIQNDVPAPLLVEDAGAHAGFALPLEGGQLLMATGQPDGVAWFDGEGNRGAQQMGCTGLGGALRVGDHVAVGCDDGLWRLDPAAPDSTPTTIAYPSGKRTGAWKGHVDQPLVASVVDGAVSVLDVDAEDGWTLATDTPICDVAFEPAVGESLVALGDDGRVRLLDPKTGALHGAFDVANAMACDTPDRPRLAVAPQHAYVSRPASGEVVELDLENGTIVGRYDVGGTPGQLLVLGVDAANRNAGPCPSCK